MRKAPIFSVRRSMLRAAALFFAAAAMTSSMSAHVYAKRGYFRTEYAEPDPGTGAGGEGLLLADEFVTVEAGLAVSTLYPSYHSTGSASTCAMGAKNLVRTEAGYFASAGDVIMFALSGGRRVCTAGKYDDGSDLLREASVRAELNDHFIYDGLYNASDFFFVLGDLPSLFAADYGLPELEPDISIESAVGSVTLWPKWDGIRFEYSIEDGVIGKPIRNITRRFGYASLTIFNTSASAHHGMSRIDNDIAALAGEHGLFPLAGGRVTVSNGTSEDPNCMLKSELNDHYIYQVLTESTSYRFADRQDFRAIFPINISERSEDGELSLLP